MNSETLEHIENLIIEIKAEPSYKDFIRTNALIDDNKEIQVLIERFKLAEKRYQEALKYGKHYPGLKELQKAFIEAKTSLYQNDTVKKHKEAERTLQDILDQCALSIAEVVSKRIFVQTRLPFMSQKGGSSCSVDKAS